MIPNPETVEVIPEPQSSRVEDNPGVPVVLADGLTWFLAIPTVRYRPKLEIFENTKRIGLTEQKTDLDVFVGYPRSIEKPLKALTDRLAESIESTPVGLVFEVAAEMLRRCHEISRAQALALLECDDVGLVRLIDAIGRATRAEFDSDPIDPIAGGLADDLIVAGEQAERLTQEQGGDS